MNIWAGGVAASKAKAGAVCGAASLRHFYAGLLQRLPLLVSLAAAGGLYLFSRMRPTPTNLLQEGHTRLML